MDRARDDYTREERSKLEELERSKLEELERSKRRQRELDDELRMLKARENQLRDEVAEGKELQQKVNEVRRVRRRDDGQVGVGGGGGGEEEEEEEEGGRVFVSTGNSACMPKNARQDLLLKCSEILT